MDVNNEFSFIGRMTSAFSNTLDFLYNNQILSRRIRWGKSGYFEDPDSCPNVSLKLSENGSSSTFSSSTDVNNEFSFIGRMMSAFSNTLDFLYNNQILSRRIRWGKSEYFEDPHSSPAVSLKSGLPGRNLDVW
ncbi:hypothetical protein AVEN_188367-1 [Araneus ventricosus]|uniref:Uncharacterized protein n=1 Tax=Araneus ventricosus TaxID=182803 RepID=A0A4Y2H6R2_ARAVE|nr:hypothetical protein AVEN_188367-1 [Araneus ventricosus]